MPRRVGALYKLLRAACLIAALLGVGASAAVAATAWNASSPLGINLTSVTYFSTEQPFVNIFVTNGGWITHGKGSWDTHEERYLQLDADGYPKTLAASRSDPNSPQRFDSVGVILDAAEGKYLYPAGSYVVLYDGDGKLTYGSDAKLVSSSPGRDVIDVAKPSAAGIDLRIIATDPHHDGNYLRNIRVMRQKDEAAFDSGQLFDPGLLNMLKRFRVLRFMDWLRTNGNPLSCWSDRPHPSYYRWSTRKGVPIETAVALANAVSADAWLNVPAMADDEFIERMAALVHARLGPGQKVYVEYSNEVWNSSFPQYQYASARGGALWPNRPPGSNGYEWNRNWYGMRTAQMCDMWRAVWGTDRDRVVCVLAAQAAYTYSATDSLNCGYWVAGAPCSRHGIGAVAIAPYFGDGNMPSWWAGQADGGRALLFKSLGRARDTGRSSGNGTLANLIARLGGELRRHHLTGPGLENEPGVPAGGWFHEVAQWETSYAAILARYHLPMIAYEGGQGFVGGSNAAATELFTAANRDPRMGTAYSEYLRQWKENSGELFVLYDDVGEPSRYGEWGAVDSLMQLRDSATDLPPKWRAIQDFITRTPCWWPHCSALVAPRRRNRP